MTRALLIPAAGSGSRLGSAQPKVLTPVGGRPMLDLLVAVYAPWVHAAAIVTAPGFDSEVAERLRGRFPDVHVSVQARPTGMLDAILIGMRSLAGVSTDRVWITWCDQVLISSTTVEHLARLETEASPAEVILPVAVQTPPYIHLESDPAGRLHRVRQRREGDDMPVTGLSDCGLFSLSRAVATEALLRFAQEVQVGRSTGERNFLPFLPWMAAQGRIVTFEVAPEESRGINTPADAAFAAGVLQGRHTDAGSVV